MYLLDTNVISEFRKINSSKMNTNVLRWAKKVETSSLYLSAITILELEIGILLLERKDVKQADMLRVWLDEYILPAFSNRILVFDTRVAKQCAKLHIPNRQPERDAIIAATALTHSMIVVTRNTQDFLVTDLKIINPWNT